LVVRNKIESDRIIRDLGVNYSPFCLVYNQKEAEKAIAKIKELIGIREKRAGGGHLITGLTVPQAFSFVNSKNMVAYPCSIYHDMRETEDHLRYQGEIQLHPDGTMCGIYNTTPGIKNREACIRSEAVRFGTYYQSPAILDEVSWDWRPVRDIVDYCCDYDLIGPVIEYSLYDVPVGWKNEFVVIWEIRNY